MAGLGGGGGAADGLNAGVVNAGTSEQTFLTTPRAPEDFRVTCNAPAFMDWSPPFEYAPLGVNHPVMRNALPP